jgi:hypothetical protein
LLIVDLYHPRRRQQLQAAFDAGQFQLADELALLSEDQLRPLVRFSLWLFLAGLVFFGGLNWMVYAAIPHQAFPVSFGVIFLFCLLNVLAYIAVLPLHEAIHALVMLAWGGKPHFGIKFLAGTRTPVALYCGAKGQLFRRNVYLAVALAPFVCISVGGIILTLLAPILAASVLLATVGNCSGAAGDLLVVGRLLRLPSSSLIEDTETGYRAWQHIA